MKLNKNKRRINFLLVLALVVQFFVPALVTDRAYAEKARVIDRIDLSESNNKIDNRTTYDLKGYWSIEDASKKSGDSFTLQLPKEIEYNGIEDSLYLISPDGKIYAEGKFDRSSNRIDFIFTDLVEKEANVRGEFFINGLTTKREDSGDGIVNRPIVIKEDKDVIYEGEVEVDTGSVGIIGGPEDLDQNIKKWDSSNGHLKDNKALWSIDINAGPQEERIEGLIELEDRLGPGHRLLPDTLNISFKNRWKSHEEGVAVVESGKVKEENLARFPGASIDYIPAEDGKSFKLKINTGGKLALVQYNTEIEKPIKQFQFDNYLDIKYSDRHGKDVEEKDKSKLVFANMGGTGQGSGTKGDIKIKKVDEDGKLVKEASFKILRYNLDSEGNKSILEEFDMETSGGVLTLDNMVSGVYGIREVESPDGYIKYEEEIIRVIDFDEIKDYKKKASMIVNKKEIERVKGEISSWINEDSKDTYYAGNNIYDLGIILDDRQLISYGREIMSNASVDKEWLKSNYFDKASDRIDKLSIEIEESVKILEKLGYSIEEDALVIEVENKAVDSTFVDFELTKKWEIEKEHRENLGKDLVAEFQLKAYKLINGRPSQLGDEDQDLKEKLEEVYSVTYDGKSEDILRVENLPYTDKYGNRYVYNMVEISDLDNFEVENSQVIDNKKIITNRYTAPESLDIKVDKEWIDDNNKESKRPASIDIYLLEDGKISKEVSISVHDGWSYTFKNLRKYNSQGEEINYSIEEKSVDGYSTSIEGFKIINELDKVPEDDRIEIKVRKEWQDSDGNEITDYFNNHEGVSVELYRNIKGMEARKYEYTSSQYSNVDGGIILSPENNWSYTFRDLEKYDDEGNEYEYGVREIGLPDFESTVHGNMKDDEIVIVNKIKTNNLLVSKKWLAEDGKELDKIEEDSIEVILKKGREVISKVSLSEDNNWMHKFENLPVYELVDGQLEDIEYKIEEVNIPEGYTSEIVETDSGFEIINRKNPEDPKLGDKSLKVEKKWSIGDKSKPVPVEVELIKNGEETGHTVELSEVNNWTHTFHDLDYYSEYKVKELTELAWIDDIDYNYDAGYVRITNIEYPKPVEPEEPEPVEPTEPENPKPVEPEEPEPVEPTEPENPKPVEPEEPEEEEDETLVGGEKVDPEEPITEDTEKEEPGKKPVVVSPKEDIKENTLPKTGEDNNIVVLVGILLLVFGIGLNILNRRKLR